MIKNIIFDFDGVICDSVHIKTDAFYDMYLPYGEDIANRVKAYHLENGGVSRFEKFKYFEKNFLHKEITEERLLVLSNQFSKIVMQKIIKLPIVENIYSFLEKEYQNYNCFIVSATPHEEINLIAKEKHIDRYFKEICGSPKNKVTWVQELLKIYNLQEKETLFIGDAQTDIDAAKATHLHFLLRKTEENSNLQNKLNNCFDDTTQLDSYIKENFK